MKEKKKKRNKEENKYRHCFMNKAQISQRALKIKNILTTTQNWYFQKDLNIKVLYLQASKNIFGYSSVWSLF